MRLDSNIQMFFQKNYKNFSWPAGVPEGKCSDQVRMSLEICRIAVCGAETTNFAGETLKWAMAGFAGRGRMENLFLSSVAEFNL